MTLTGGCLCGGARFQTDQQPLMIRHCHCVMCRKMTGSAFMTGLMYRADAIQWSGQTNSYESSPGIVRVFCGNCGSSLAFRQTVVPEKDCLLLGAFDDPSQIQIGRKVDHIFAERELDWLRIDDGLPRNEGMPSGLHKIE
jgi:hypothetical protein